MFDPSPDVARERANVARGAFVALALVTVVSGSTALLSGRAVMAAPGAELGATVGTLEATLRSTPENAQTADSEERDDFRI